MRSQSMAVSQVAIRFVCAELALSARRRDFMMTHSYGWMGGGMWAWTLISVLVVVLLIIMINKASTK